MDPEEDGMNPLRLRAAEKGVSRELESAMKINQGNGFIVFFGVFLYVDNRVAGGQTGGAGG